MTVKQMKKEATFKALNRGGTKGAAAKLTGLSSRTIQRYKKRWGMRRDVDGSYYFETPVQRSA